MKLFLKSIAIVVLFISCSSKNVDEKLLIEKFIETQLAVSSGKYEITWVQKKKFENENDSTSFVYQFHKGVMTTNGNNLYLPPQYYSIEFSTGLKVIKNDLDLYYIIDDDYYHIVYDSILYYNMFDYYHDLLRIIHSPQNVLFKQSIIKCKNKKINGKGIYKVCMKSTDINVYNLLESNRIFVNFYSNLFIDTTCFNLKYYETYNDTFEIAGNSIYYNSFDIKNQMYNDTNIKSLILEDLNNILINKKLSVLDKSIDFHDLVFDRKTLKEENSNFNSKLSLISLKNDTSNLADFKGKYLLLDFWFMQCPPCMAGIPTLNKLFEMYKNKNFEILGINTIDNNLLGIADVAKNRKMLYKNFIGSKYFIEYFKVKSYPTYILLYPNQENFEVVELKNDKDLEYLINKLNSVL